LSFLNLFKYLFYIVVVLGAVIGPPQPPFITPAVLNAFGKEDIGSPHPPRIL